MQGSVVAALLTELSPIEDQQLAYYLIQENYRYVVIVPTVCGQMINENVWALFTSLTILKESSISEQKWANFVPKPLAADAVEQLGLAIWDLPEIENANQLSLAVSSTMLVASQIAEFENLPDLSEAGERLLIDHSLTYSKMLSEWLQMFLNDSDTLIESFNALSESEREDHPDRVEAVSVLVEVVEVVRPPDWTDEQHLNLNEIVEYAQKLSTVFVPAEIARLFWIADVIDSFLKQSSKSDCQEI